jgi:hypothetical protein
VVLSTPRLTFDVSERGMSLVSLIVFGVRRPERSGDGALVARNKDPKRRRAALAAALQIFWLFIYPSRASATTNRPAHFARHHFGLRKHAQKILA